MFCFLIFRLCCSTYEEAIERIDTPKMWQLFVDTLFVLCENKIVRPKIRQKIHQVCHRALMNEKLSDEQLNDWVKQGIFHCFGYLLIMFVGM